MSTTTHTTRIVGGVAANMRAMIETDLGGDFTFAVAQKRNAEGWTVELPASLGNTVRHEGITLSAQELERAWQMAAKA